MMKIKIEDKKTGRVEFIQPLSIKAGVFRLKHLFRKDGAGEQVAELASMHMKEVGKEIFCGNKLYTSV